MFQSASSSWSVTSYYKPDTCKRLIEAESLWCSFVAEHNIAFQASDHATKLFHRMFPDSEVAKRFACSHTKTAAIIKEALGPHYTKKAIHDMAEFFSVMMDELNDKVDKSCIILARVFDASVGDVRTRFIDMPIVNIGTAQHLFDALKASLSANGLKFEKCLGFMSDTTNVMKGARSGVQRLIRNECCHVLDVPCICHLADLAVKAGMQVLPVDIDKLFVDIFYYFYHSSKRKQEFCDHWCSLFTTEPQTILKHCTTRWLSLLRCVGRYIAQFDGLKSYFLSCSEAETAKVVSIIKQLENPFTKPILHFLSFVLPSMDKFNRLFQKSTENTTTQLYNEMSRLVRLYASNLLKHECIVAASADLRKLSFKEEDQLADENLGVGDATWAFISELEEEFDPKPFFKAVRSFYIATLNKMLKKFPFGDTVLQDLGIINPENTSTYEFSTVTKLVKRFQQLGLNDPESIDALRSEFNDFKLSVNDLPSVETYKSATNDDKPRPGRFWNEVSKMQTYDGNARFPLLCKLMMAILTIPASNADSERGFSILRKIHTDQRPSLKQESLVALMAIKFNSEDYCHNTSFSEDLLTMCKKATVKANKQKN